MKKPNPKPKRNRKIPLTRRQFIGTCAAGATAVQLAPLISFSGCINDLPKEKVYHPLSKASAVLTEMPTKPKLDTIISGGNLQTTIEFDGFFSFKKTLKVKDPTHPIGGNIIKTFNYISMEQMGCMNQNGRPELPYLALLYHVPKFVKPPLLTVNPIPEIISGSSSEDEYKYHKFPNLIPYPSQAELFDNEGLKKNYSIYADYDNAVYNSAQFFPVEENQLVEEAGSFDYGYSRLFIYKIRPLIFNPKYTDPDTGYEGPMILGYNKIILEFSFEADQPISLEHRLETPFLPEVLDTLPRHERIIDPWYEPLKVNDLLGYSAAGSIFTGNVVADYEQIGPDLLIVHPDQFMECNEPGNPLFPDPVGKLATHKGNSGFQEVETISISQETDYHKIIRDKRECKGYEGNLIPYSRLRHVILFGDVSLIRAATMNRVLNVKHKSDDPFYSNFKPHPPEMNRKLKKEFMSDYYNGSLKDPDNDKDIVVSDISVGRIPVRTIYEAGRVVQNIKDYDSIYTRINKKLTFVSYYQDLGPGAMESDGEASNNYLQTMEYIRNKLDQSIEVQTVYQKQRQNGSDYRLRYLDGTNIDPSVSFSVSKDSKDEILKAFATGGRFIVHRDHGYMDGWSRPSFKIPDTWSLISDKPIDPEPSIVFNMNCLSGHFYGEKSRKLNDPGNDCFSEALIAGIKLPNGNILDLKCPAVIAAVDESPTYHNDWLIKGIFDVIFGGILSSEPRDPDDLGKNRLGDVLNLGKMLLYTSLEESGLNLYENEIYHLLGDPTLRV